MAAVTRSQKEMLYEDGFLVIKNIIPRELVVEARRLVNLRMGELRTLAVKGKNLALIREMAGQTFRGNEVFLDLFNRTPLKKTLEALLGAPVPAAQDVQLAANYPTGLSDRINEAGYYDKDTPFHGWCGHLDGLWNGGARVPRIEKKMTSREKKNWYSDPSRNSCIRCYPEFNTNIRNFTALVGVPLTDQREKGVGNLGLLKGAHLRMEKIFQAQYAAGGPIGPDGPGWQRENFDAFLRANF